MMKKLTRMYFDGKALEIASLLQRDGYWHFNPYSRHTRDEHREIVDALVRLFNKEKGIGTVENIPDTVKDYIYKGVSYSPVAEIKSDEESKMGAFAYIPHNEYEFVKSFPIMFPHGKRFIDVGSGIGDKVALAKLFGRFDTVSGIELNTYSYSISVYMLTDYFGGYHVLGDGRKLGRFSHKGHDMFLFNRNALSFDFGEYDSVYMYMPINNDEGLTGLHLQAVNTMPVGGRLWEIGEASPTRIAQHHGKNTWQEYVGDRLKRKVRVSEKGHLVEVLE